MIEEDKVVLLAEKNPSVAKFIDRFDLHLDFTKKREYRQVYNYPTHTTNADFL